MTEDAELLRRYAAEKSDPAFAELVQRHLGLVYHAALRHLQDHPAAAEDVAQVVFADLAARAGSLSRHPLLAGWLHTRTRYAALNYLRAERRRQAREHAAHLMAEIIRETEPAADWARLRPVIDDALQALRPGDREAILMRFFEGRGFAEVGAQLQLTEDGARARVERALEKMQTLLFRRGVVSTSGALSLALTQHAAALAPAGLAASVTGAVLSGAAASTGSALALGTLSLMKVTTLVLTGSLAANAILGALYVRETPPPSLAAPVAAATTPVATPTPAADATPDLKALYDPDPAAFLAKLRTAQVPERIRRALIEATLDEQFRAREEALLPTRPPVGWWQWQDDRVPLKTSLALLDLRREKEKLRLQLLGPDPEALAADDGDNPIPPDKRAMLKLVAEDYSAMLAALRFTGSMLPAERQQLQLVEEQRKKDLAALLTPAEFAAYEERMWSGLSELRERLRYANVDEREFKVLKEAAQRRSGLSRVTMADQEKELDQLHAALGEARFDDIQRSRQPDFNSLQAMLDRAGRPVAAAAPVYTLWQDAEVESMRIDRRTDLSREQKIAAVRQLGTHIRAEIMTQLGPEVGAAFLKDAFWLRTLDNGQVLQIFDSGYQGLPPGSPQLTTSPRQRPRP